LNACKFQNVKTVEQLLRNKDININVHEKVKNNLGHTPLTYACESGSLAIVELLLKDERINVNLGNVGQTPFYYACLNSRADIAKLLLKNKDVDINLTSSSHGRTPLIQACSKGRIEIVREILMSGRDVNINAQCNGGKTAIEIASEKGYRSIVDLLESFLRSPSRTRERLLEKYQCIFFYFFIVLFLF